jgi:X-Pro dipeptidyl-peptidase
VDAGRALDTDDVLIQTPDVANPNRLVYRSSALRAPAHLSGTPLVDLRMSIVNRSAANLTAVLVDYGTAGAAPVMVTRGWLDPQNRARIASSQSVRPGREYSLRFDLQPDDHVFAAGHRIGLVVVSTDHDYTLRPAPGTELTLRPASSVLTLPLVTP